nr:MAG TPA_asm: hypothetical protein [Caudoviricetes sp.]
MLLKMEWVGISGSEDESGEDGSGCDGLKAHSLVSLH